MSSETAAATVTAVAAVGPSSSSASDKPKQVTVPKNMEENAERSRLKAKEMRKSSASSSSSSGQFVVAPAPTTPAAAAKVPTIAPPPPPPPPQTPRPASKAVPRPPEQQQTPHGVSGALPIPVPATGDMKIELVADSDGPAFPEATSERPAHVPSSSDPFAAASTQTLEQGVAEARRIADAVKRPRPIDGGRGIGSASGGASGTSVTAEADQGVEIDEGDDAVDYEDSATQASLSAPVGYLQTATSALAISANQQKHKQPVVQLPRRGANDGSNQNDFQRMWGNMMASPARTGCCCCIVVLLIIALLAWALGPH